MMKTPGESYDIFLVEYYKKQGLMSNMAKSTHLPRVLFFGMQGRFSYAPLRTLLEAGIKVCAIVIPAEQGFELPLPPIQKQEQPPLSHSSLTMLSSPIHSSILDLAKVRNIPVWKVRQLSSPETIKTLTAYQPDMICVACFSKLIPRDVLDIPRLGCLNVHPSLLPANRGPEPLFWTFREGNEQTGVTIHLMDEGLDSGAIVAQEAIEIPDGTSYSDLEEMSAELGGNLLAKSVWELYNGIAIQVAQDEMKSSYHPFPSEDDFVVPVEEWHARHVYNFICGVASWGTPIHILVGNKSIQIKKAISYSQKTIDQNGLLENEKSDKSFWIRCKQGSVLIECI
jgi:methionyl-tRNA formyltransferase